MYGNLVMTKLRPDQLLEIQNEATLRCDTFETSKNDKRRSLQIATPSLALK